MINFDCIPHSRPLGCPSISSRSPHFDSFAPAHSDIRPSLCAALGAGAELVALVFEQDVGCMISNLYLGTSRRTRPLVRGVAGHVVDSRSPDRLGRIPIDQCSPSAGFPARCMHPIRSIEKDYRFETDEASFAGANFTAGGCELRIEPVGRAR